jgi:modulator of FtsH protease HflK
MIDPLARNDRDAPQMVLNEEGPWGNDREPAGDKDAPRNPWTQPPRRKPRGAKEGQPSLEELIRRGRARFSGQIPGGGGRSIWPYALALFVVLWLATTCLHRIDPQQRGVITRFGAYAGTLQPGIGLTLPAPIDVVTRVNVDETRSFDVPVSGGPNLLLTRGQDLVNVGYTVRWSVRDPEAYLFELQAPQEDVIRDAAQSAMREAVAQLSLAQVTGPAQGALASGVAERLQGLLDRYHAGIQIQGVTIRDASTPSQLADVEKDIATARSEAQSVISDAKREASDAVAGAQGQATAFDKVYQAYKLSPEVTRTRMYYDTMDAVMAKTDKVIVDTPNATVNLPPPPAKKAQPAQPQQGGGQ